MALRTSERRSPFQPWKSAATSGALTRLPPKLHVASFQPYSFSLVRAYRCIIR